MKTISFITICIAIFSLASCSKDNAGLSKSDYLIFGHFYASCSGEGCVEIFRLEQDKLFEDKKDQYPDAYNFYNGKYGKLSQQKFDITKDLKDYFPVDLLNEPGNVIGQPDAGDWGGLYIEYNYGGIRKFWLLDLKKSNVPATCHGFIDKVNEKIAQLK
ncbi:MAG: hypothetical protein JNM88_04525 [Chitinophagaceae bacterium]|nr:hypothetical protein [Chitinophagaceae bacterium]